MSLPEKVQDASASLAVAAISSVAGAAVWIVRRVFTNQKQIEMAQKQMDMMADAQAAQIVAVMAEIKARDELRKSDSGKLDNLHQDVRELRNAILATKKE
jgi:hypothetical protein